MAVVSVPQDICPADVAEHLQWLVGALTALNDDSPDDAVGGMVDGLGEGVATPAFVTASTLLAWFLVGGVCHCSGRDVASVLRELGAWAATSPDAGRQ